MSTPEKEAKEELRRRALSRWDDEGGATAKGPHADLPAGEDQYELRVTKVEFADLHARLIAVEHVAISLLVTSTDRQIELAREMAALIYPRPGKTPHPLSITAAHHIDQLVDRALRFRDA